MSRLQQVVAKFLAERDQVITAINNCPTSNMEDYWRWQGNAEARRVLTQDLERDGIDLHAEPRPVEELVGVLTDPDWGKAPAQIKADALREAARAQRQLAADARTNNGQAEHTDIADWLDEQADAIDPAVVEGAHP